MRIQLFYNSPKARRYFRAIQCGLAEETVGLAPIGLAGGGGLDSRDVSWISAYSIARKRARPHLSDDRLARATRILHRFARWHYAAAWQRMARWRPDVVGVWGGQSVDARAVRAAAAALDIPCVLFETGLLPDSTTADARGVNAEASVPADPRFYEAYRCSAELPTRFTPRKAPEAAPEPLPSRYVFVPFQVALDSQVLLYSSWIRDMSQLYWLLDGLMRDLPESLHLVCKPHPSCPEPYRQLRRHAAAHPRLHIVDQHTSEALIRGAEGVLTLNSSVGIEGLLLGRPVLCLGEACYAVPGVAERARSPEAVRAWLSARADGIAAEAPLRRSFLNWLANEYVIPGSFRAPGATHFESLRARLRDAARSREARSVGAAVAA
jgi:capsular polysaccharide export protein